MRDDLQDISAVESDHCSFLILSLAGFVFLQLTG